jgi:hypothetical protein
MSTRLLLPLLAGVTLSAAAPSQSIAELFAVIAPDKSEQAWLEIPWQTDLTAARRKAAAENKPIFLWEMDGHPLGCT